jgi:hypothetical protein
LVAIDLFLNYCNVIQRLKLGLRDNTKKLRNEEAWGKTRIPELEVWKNLVDLFFNKLL